MKNKTIIAILLFIIIALFSTICMAETNSVDLKDEMNNSMNKTEDTMENMTNMIFDGKNKMMEKGKDNGDAGINNTSVYNTTRTTVDDAYYNSTTLDTTTWIWIILGVAAIIIIAAIWYYAMQSTDDGRRD